MLSFFNKIRRMLKAAPADAMIVGEVKFNESNTPLFTVKMRGCKTLVEINAEDIVERFAEKFSSIDIRKATKIWVKYQSLLRLVSIEKHFAILFNDQNHAFQCIDLSDNLFLRHGNIDNVRPEDAFKLGVHFEKMRSEKDRKFFNLTKRDNMAEFRLVKREHSPN